MLLKILSLRTISKMDMLMGMDMGMDLNTPMSINTDTRMGTAIRTGVDPILLEVLIQNIRGNL